MFFIKLKCNNSVVNIVVRKKMCNFARLLPCIAVTNEFVMKQKLSNIIILVALAMAAVGCSTVQKIINTGDAQFIYERAKEYYADEKWSKAYALLEVCEPYYRGTMREDSVTFYKARCSFKDGDYYSAAEMLDTFRRTFSRSVFIEDAEAMYAICLYNMCPSPERDQSTTSQAIIAISEYMAHYPESEQLVLFKDMTADLTWRLHEKAYINAYTYYKIGRYNAAIIAFRNALKMYSDTHRREDLLYHITMASFKLAENSVEEKRLDRYMSTLDAYYSFVMEFPESKYSKEMEQVAEVTKRYIEKNKQGE